MSDADKGMTSCSKACMEKCVTCPFEECRYWIPYEEEFNCSLVSIYVNGSMTLQEVGDRLGISFVRVCQIEKNIKNKLRTNANLSKLFSKQETTY